MIVREEHPHTAGRTESLIQHYAEVRARLMGPRLVARRRPSPNVVLPIEAGCSLAEVIDVPIATTPCPLNMLAAPSWRFLVAYAAIKHAVDVSDILSPLRSRPVVAARHEAMHLCRGHISGVGLTRLGMYFGRDHTTILTSLKRYEKRKAAGSLSPLSTVFTGEAQKALPPC